MKSESVGGSRVIATEIAVGAAFFLTAASAMLVGRISGGVYLLWPASACVAGLLIRLPPTRLLRVVPMVGALSVVASVWIAHHDWRLALSYSALQCGEVTLMAWLFRSVLRLSYPTISVGQGTLLTGVLGIAIPGLLALAAGALLHAAAGLSFSQLALRWWSSHTVGACLVAPPILLGSATASRRLLRAPYAAENVGMLIVVLLVSWLAIHYLRSPFVVISLFLVIAAFRVGAFGASLLSLCSGLMITALWSFGAPAGEGPTPLLDLPVIALLATTIPPIAVGVGSDLRRAMMHRLKQSEWRFREAMEHSPIGMVIAGLDGVWGYTNLALQRMLGYSAAEFRALPPGGPSEPEEWHASSERWMRLLSGEIDHYDVERRFRHKDGHWVWTHVAVSSARDETGVPRHLVAQIESLEERRQAEEKLAEERERLRITLTSIADAVITTDGEMAITYANAAAEQLLGQSLRQLQHQRLDAVMALTAPDSSKAATSLVAKSLIRCTTVRRESAVVLHRPDGSVCYVKDVVSPILGGGGQLAGLAVILQDASADFERDRDLVHRASHDTLTNLSNRSEFERRLARAFAQSNHYQKPAALFVIDLDRFKTVNDSGGHAAGDAVLRGVADVLREAVRGSDIVARLGGDEFAVLLPQCPEHGGLSVGRQILRALNPLEVEWQGTVYSAGASLGLAMLTPKFKDEADWLAAADHACYQAKNRGSGQLHLAGEAATEPAARAVSTG